MIKCDGCGMGMRFDPLSQMLVCDYCNSTKPVQQNESDVISKETEGYDTFESTLFTCPMCGAEILSDSDSAVTFCSFCGSSVTLEGRLVKMVAPTMVLPFKKAKKNVENDYRAFIKKAVFAPKYMQEEGKIEKLRGIYMPYWVYDFGHEGRVSFDGVKSYRRGDYVYTDHYDLSANVSAKYQGIAFDASSSFADELSEAIAPYNIKDSKPFAEGYMSGFYADTADVVAEVYESNARDIVATDISNKIVSRPKFRGYTIKDKNMSNANLSVNAKQMAYFPVWFLSIKQKEYVSYAVINGQTGKIAADIPIDYKKFLIGSLIVSIPLMIIFDLFISLRPVLLCLTAIIFAIIALCIANNELNLIYTRNHYLDDKGLQYARKQNEDDDEPKMYMPKQQAKDPVKTAQKSAYTLMIMILASMVVIPIIAVTTENATLIMGIFFAMFGVAIYGSVSSSVQKKEQTVTSKRATYKQPFSEKKGVLLKPIIAIVLGVLLLMVNPFEDMVYYGCTLGIMALVLVCFVDVIGLHNKLTKRIPRQFAKRGGDE